jgi:DNA-binding SARP family transcriptional activator
MRLDNSLYAPGFSREPRLLLLDGFRLENVDSRTEASRGTRRLVAFLGVYGRTTRAEIADTLWPEATETRARANLRTVLWRLNRMRPSIVTAAQDLLTLHRDVRVDLTEFLATARGVLALNGEMGGGTAALATLTAAGELLPGWYDDWVLRERERLRQIRLHALEVLATRLTEGERYGEAIEAALAAVQLEPLRESAVRTLISVHLAEHNLAEALRLYESFRKTLATELRVAPSQELQELIARTCRIDARRGAGEYTWWG